MIDFIVGKVNDILNDYIVIEHNGMGYLIYMNEMDILKIRVGEEVKIYTRMIVTERDISLYGFIKKDSRTLFDLLKTVTGIGPKGSNQIVGSIGDKEIRKAILDEDTKIISKAPGVGKKTAERIVLELRDKISKISFEDRIDFSNVNNEIIIESTNPAIEALISLGYNEYEAKNALSNIDTNLDISDIIKEALKLLG